MYFAFSDNIKCNSQKGLPLLKLVVPFPKSQGHATFEFHLGHVKGAKGNSEDYLETEPFLLSHQQISVKYVFCLCFLSGGDRSNTFIT